MQIINLVLKNFKQYKDAAISFPEGLTGFIGSNGAGKSTIFEAITLAFYGRFETNKDSIKNDKASAKEILSVELTFADKEKIYKVIRELKGKNLKAEAELYIDDVLSVNGAKEVNKELLKVLKIDYSNFKNSFFASQKEVTSLINLTEKEREKSIRKMLGLEKLDKLDDRIKEKVKETKTKIEYSEKNLLSEDELKEINESKSDYEQELKELNSSLEKSKDENTEFEKSYGKLKKELNDSEVLKTKYDSINNNIGLIKERITSNQEIKKKTEQEISELQKMLEEIKKLEPQKNQYLEENKLYEKLLRLKTEYQRKEQLGKIIEKEKTQLNELLKEKSDKENEIELLKSADEKLKTTNKLIDEKIKTKKAVSKNRDLINGNISKDEGAIKESAERLSRIKEIGKKSNCPECERPLEDHYDKLIEKYRSEIAKYEIEIKVNRKELENVELELESIDKEISSLNKDISMFENEIEKRENLNKEIKSVEKKIGEIGSSIKENEKELNEIKDIQFDEKLLSKAEKNRKDLFPAFEKYNDHKSKTEQLPKRELELKEINERETELNKNFEAESKSLKELKFDAEKHNQLKEKREEAETQLRELDRKLQEIKNQITISKNKIDELLKELQRDELNRKEIDELKNKFNLYERLKGFINEFKSKVTSQELPAISNEASKLFSGITKNRYLNLRIDQSFNFLVNREDKEVELQTLSGGEKDLASLCLRVAISKRISALAGRTNMGFLALDEVFGSQDEERREELLSALVKISDEFKQIFVVSHNQDVHEAFPQRLMIKKVNGFSKAELVT